MQPSCVNNLVCYKLPPPPPKKKKKKKRKEFKDKDTASSTTLRKRTQVVSINLAPPKPFHLREKRAIPQTWLLLTPLQKVYFFGGFSGKPFDFRDEFSHVEGSFKSCWVWGWVLTGVQQTFLFGTNQQEQFPVAGGEMQRTLLVPYPSMEAA